MAASRSVLERASQRCGRHLPTKCLGGRSNERYEQPFVKRTKLKLKCSPKDRAIATGVVRRDSAL